MRTLHSRYEVAFTLSLAIAIGTHGALAQTPKGSLTESAPVSRQSSGNSDASKCDQQYAQGLKDLKRQIEAADKQHKQDEQDCQIKGDPPDWVEKAGQAFARASLAVTKQRIALDAEKRSCQVIYVWLNECLKKARDQCAAMYCVGETQIRASEISDDEIHKERIVDCEMSTDPDCLSAAGAQFAKDSEETRDGWSSLNRRKVFCDQVNLAWRHQHPRGNRPP